MKRVFVVLITLSLLLAGIPCYAQEDAAKVVGETLSTTAGREIEYRVSIEGNPGISSIGVNISFDTAVFSAVVDEENGGVLCTAGENFSKMMVNASYSSSKCKVVCINFDNANVTENGLLFSIKLKVADSAEPGEYPINISCDKNNTFNAAEEEVAFVCIDGSVAVREFVPTISGETKEVKQGESFDYQVSIIDNPGIANYAIKIAFDSDLFSLEKRDNAFYSRPANEFGSGFSETRTDIDGEISIVWGYTGNVSAEGILFTIHFKAKENARLGDAQFIVTLLEAPTNIAEQSQTFQLVSGSITVQTSAVVEKTAASTHSITVTVASSPAKQAVVALYQPDGKLVKLSVATLSDKGCTVTVQDNNLDFSKLTCKVMLLNSEFIPTMPLFIFD